VLAKTMRIPSPEGALIAVYHYSPSDSDLVTEITFTDSVGRVLFSDDFTNRDYRPEKGRWTASGRFFVYTLYSQGGHSPWHKPFIIANTLTRKLIRETELGEGDCVSEFRLSDRDTISYKVLDREESDWEKGVPGIPKRFSLSQKLAAQ